jgi:hypothetical protein
VQGIRSIYGSAELCDSNAGKISKTMRLSELPADVREKIEFEFRTDNGSSEIDEIEIDETNEVIAVGHRCTKPSCNCVGGWWEQTGVRPIGRTVIVSA